MKARIQRFLKTFGLYYRLKNSRLYDAYWAIADRRLYLDRKRELEFYCSLLPHLQKGSLIFDIGANHGHKSSIFLALGAHVVAVDPDPHNQSILRASFHERRFRAKPVTIVNKAVSDSVGEATFWIDEPGGAKNTLSRKWVDTLREDDARFGSRLDFGRHHTVKTTTLDALISEYGQPLFIKIDVEGHEPDVIRGLTQAVPFLSFEVNLPEFLQEGIECILSLQHLNPTGQFNLLADSQCCSGLALDGWLDGTAFKSFLESCNFPSVEVIWRNPAFRSIDLDLNGMSAPL